VRQREEQPVIHAQSQKRSERNEESAVVIRLISFVESYPFAKLTRFQSRVDQEGAANLVIAPIGVRIFEVLMA
jgi:hypothetical protein